MYEATVSHFALKLNGQQAPERLMRDMLECIVENSLHLPDMCVIRVHDAEFHWLDTTTFDAGTKVEVLAGLEGKGQLKSIFIGEVVAEEVDMAAHGLPTLTVRCLDKSHRLHRGRKQRSFQNVTDSDIVKKVAGEHGLELKIESTKVVHDWVFQNNQTDWEFLQERAARNGFRLYVKGNSTLKFEKIENGSASKLKVEWGKELRSFRPRLTASNQVDEVVVKGWDPKAKAPIIGISKSPRGTPKTKVGAHGGKNAQKAFAQAKMVVCDKPVHSQAEADEIAASIMDSIGNSYLEADGLCYGTPDLKPGVLLEVGNIGQKYKGEYTVTSTTHTYTPAEGYSTLFSISGKRTPSLLAQLHGDENTSRTKLGGNIVVGIVVDNKDTSGLHRVKVKYPWLTEEHMSFWARIASPMAGSGRGMFILPEIGDEVLVAFEHGDIHRPYVLGQLWNGKDKPPGTNSKDNKNPIHGGSSEVNRRGFTTRIGHTMDFDDTDGKGKIMLKTAGGHVLNLDDAGKCCDLTTTGNHKVEVSDKTKSISITSTAGHNVEVDDKSNSVTIKTAGGQMAKLTDSGGLVMLKDVAGDTLTMTSGMVNLTGMQMITLAAPIINVTGSIAVNVAALNTNIAAGALATMNGGAAVQIAGGMVVDVKSTLIKLNS